METFSHCSKPFLNSLILMPFSASAVFCFTSSTLSKCSFGGYFSSGETNKKIVGGKTEWIRRVGHRGQTVFGQKLLNTQCGVVRCTRKSPIMKWANVLTLQKKHSLKLNTTSHNNTSWYIDTDGFLEHSPGWGEACIPRGLSSWR